MRVVVILIFIGVFFIILVVISVLVVFVAHRDGDEFGAEPAKGLRHVAHLLQHAVENALCFLHRLLLRPALAVLRQHILHALQAVHHRGNGVVLTAPLRNLVFISILTIIEDFLFQRLDLIGHFHVLKQQLHNPIYCRVHRPHASPLHKLFPQVFRHRSPASSNAYISTGSSVT